MELLKLQRSIPCSTTPLAPRHLARNLCWPQITVDGDTSTNDTVLGLASGGAGGATISDPDSQEAQQLEAAVTALLQARRPLSGHHIEPTATRLISRGIIVPNWNHEPALAYKHDTVMQHPCSDLVSNACRGW